MKVSVTASLGVALLLGLHGISSAAQSTGAKIDNSVPDIKFDANNDDVDADNYLSSMRGLLERYNATVRTVVLGAVKNGSPAAAEQAANLAKDIRAVRPPRKLASEHAQLSNSLASIQNFESLGGQESQGISGLNALAAELRTTINKYKIAVAKLSSGNLSATQPSASRLLPTGATRLGATARRSSTAAGTARAARPVGAAAGDDTTFGAMPGPEAAEQLGGANDAAPGADGSNQSDQSNPMAQLLNSLLQGGNGGTAVFNVDPSGNTSVDPSGISPDPSAGADASAGTFGTPGSASDPSAGLAQPIPDVNSSASPFPSDSSGAVPTDNTSGLTDGR